MKDDKIKASGPPSECGVRHRNIKLLHIDDTASSGCDKDTARERSQENVQELLHLTKLVREQVLGATASVFSLSLLC